MQVSVKLWSEYMETWPKDQFFDRDDATFGGCSEHHTELLEHELEELVTVTKGVIWRTGYPDKSLVADLESWLAERDAEFLTAKEST